MGQISAQINIAGELTHIVWLNRPWEVRYLLFGWNQDLYKISMEAAQDLNTRKTINGKEVFALEARGLFAVPSRLALPHKKSVVTVLINFDEAGRANSPALAKGPWIAKRDMLDYLLRIDEKNPSEKPYLLASWSQGIPGDWSFSPAVCGAFDEWSCSRIRDTDCASEAMELTRSKILQQAGSAMVAQANASQGQILALLRR